MEKPRLLQGFRDFLPDQMRARQHVVETVKNVYESYGFEPLDTPVLEYADLLMGKYGEDEKLIYNFEDHGRRHVAMRYDLTVPLARVVSSYQHLPKPFKRYQVGSVWRADSPQAGRYREFMQLDADVVGAGSPLADAEMLAMTGEVYAALGLPQAVVRVNHRGVLHSILRALNVSSEHSVSVLRILDKLAKIGTKKAEELLLPSMDKNTLQQLFGLLEQHEWDNLHKELHSLLSDSEGQLALENFATILDLATDVKAVEVDLSIVRGLDYYTGIIYEVTLPDASVGSVGSGGRYDDLMKELSGVDAPSIGTSLGVDRLLAATGAQAIANPPTVLVAVFAGFEKYAFELAADIRKAGIRTSLAFGSEKLGKQMQYADAIGASKVLLSGDNEVSKDVVLVRDMKTGEQEEVKREELISKLIF